MDYSLYQINYLDILITKYESGKTWIQVYIQNPLIPTSIYLHNLVTISNIKS